MSSRLRRLALSAAVCCTAASFTQGALAQSSEDAPLYIGGSAFFLSPDSARDADDGFGSRAFFGVPINEHAIFEFSAFGTQNDRETVGGKDSAWAVGGDLLFPFTSAEAGFRPFFNIGAGYINEDILGDTDGGAMANVGLGALVRLTEGVYLRPDARYVAVFNDAGAPGEDPLYDVHVGLGLQADIGPRKPDDTDGDGVPDPSDACPDTPAGVTVDARGCPLDSDGDSVADYLDKCPNTPRGTAVDSKGCPLDSDADGVTDNLDRCPNTPRGTPVDTAGCPLDSDGDGVPDYLDKCPNTPRGLKVDATGCVREAQTVVLQNVNFEFNKATLTPDAQAVLIEVAQGLKSDPQMQVELAGHTDSVGSSAYHQRLSQQRADAVKNFLVKQGIESRRLVAKGYGEEKPVATNDTDEGRAQNRRVEFRVIAK